MLAATIRVTRDLNLAEDCVQDAYAKALTAWSAQGIPAKPGAWLTTVARRRAFDLADRSDVARRALPRLVTDQVTPGCEWAGDEEIQDDRLRLIFTCCHPALAPEAQAALALRLLCGLSTPEVARAFLVSESTMAARITRAKKKIAAARIPYRVPPLADLPGRTESVLTVVHLLFTTGHTAPAGADLVRRDLVERALDLARMLRSLLPGDPEVASLLALILLTDARRRTRVNDQGHLLLLADQDRSQWDRPEIEEGLHLVAEAIRKGRPRRFALMAAITAVHADSPSWDATDWEELVGLYDLLLDAWPSPVVALNRAVAVGFAAGPAAGLAALEPLASEPQLTAYGYLASARADLLRRLGRIPEALVSYEEALAFTDNEVEQSFLAQRIADLKSLRKEITMTGTGTPPALAVALAYHQAWTSKNLDQAMTYIADDIACDAPGARIAGAEQYRGFLGQFMSQLTGIETVAAFGDDTTAVLFYYPHTAQVRDAPTAECFTVADGKITRSVLVFDRPSFAPPQG